MQRARKISTREIKLIVVFIFLIPSKIRDYGSSSSSIMTQKRGGTAKSSVFKRVYMFYCNNLISVLIIHIYEKKTACTQPFLYNILSLV